MTELEEYQQSVENFSSSKENFEFTNKGKPHAAIVVSNLIRTAQKELLIYSGCLHREVANDENLVEMLQAFLKSGKTLKLILSQMPAEDMRSEALKNIITAEKDPAKDVHIKIDEDGKFSESARSIFHDNVAHHFMVADGAAYRLEIDASEYKALCNFNDSTIAGPLKDVFDLFFSRD